MVVDRSAGKESDASRMCRVSGFERKKSSAYFLLFLSWFPSKSKYSYVIRGNSCAQAIYFDQGRKRGRERHK